MVDFTFNGEFTNIPGFEDTPSQFPLFNAVTRETPADFTASSVFNPDVGAWEPDGGATTTLVVVQSVPEPGTIVGLLAIGGLGLGLKKKKFVGWAKRNKFEDNQESVKTCPPS